MCLGTYELQRHSFNSRPYYMHVTGFRHRKVHASADAGAEYPTLYMFFSEYDLWMVGPNLGSGPYLLAANSTSAWGIGHTPGTDWSMFRDQKPTVVPRLQSRCSKQHSHAHTFAQVPMAFRILQMPKAVSDGG